MFDHIDAVVVFVQDLAGCTTFYRDTLRLPYLGSEATASAFRLRDRTLILLSPERAAKILVLRSSLMLSFPLEKPMGRTYLLWLQTLIQRFIHTNEERSSILPPLGIFNRDEKAELVQATHLSDRRRQPVQYERPLPNSRASR